jgi:hypothetical protein
MTLFWRGKGDNMAAFRGRRMVSVPCNGGHNAKQNGCGRMWRAVFLAVSLKGRNMKIATPDRMRK